MVFLHTVLPLMAGLPASSKRYSSPHMHLSRRDVGVVQDKECGRMAHSPERKTWKLEE